MTYVLPSMSNELRSDIRAALRRHPDFPAFREARGSFASRDFDNELIAEAMAQFGMEDDIKAIVDRFNSRAPSVAEAEAPSMAEAEAEAEAPSASALADTVLSPLRPFVSDKLLSAVETALSPIVTAALKPAIEVERVVEIEVPSAGGKPAGVKRPNRHARRASKSTFGKVFGCPRHARKDAPVQLWDSPDAEARDPFYVVEPDQMSLLVTAAERGGNVWLAGPAGGGKSSMPQQYAALTGRPFVLVAFNRAVDIVDLIGQPMLDGSSGTPNQVWCDGVLTQAIRQPGTVILLDEITLAPAGALAILQTLMSAREMVVHATGERVKVADGVVFCCADNTRGYGDETGLYSGTTQANAALVDRMSRMLFVDYLPADLEAQALHNHTPGSTRLACDRVVAFIGGVRKLTGFENRPMSLRRMIAFVHAVQDGYSTDIAFENVMLSRLPDAERAALYAHIKANFDKGAFLAEMAGQAAPAAPSAPSSPAQAAAQNAFTAVS